MFSVQWKLKPNWFCFPKLMTYLSNYCLSSQAYVHLKSGGRNIREHAESLKTTCEANADKLLWLQCSFFRLNLVQHWLTDVSKCFYSANFLQIFCKFPLCKYFLWLDPMYFANVFHKKNHDNLVVPADREPQDISTACWPTRGTHTLSSWSYQ